MDACKRKNPSNFHAWNDPPIRWRTASIPAPLDRCGTRTRDLHVRTRRIPLPVRIDVSLSILGAAQCAVT